MPEATHCNGRAGGVGIHQVVDIWLEMRSVDLPILLSIPTVERA